MFNKLKFLAAPLATLFLASSVYSAEYKIDQAHSEVGFKIRHLVAKTSGRFDDFSGTIKYDGKNLKSLETMVTIKTASINTNNEKRDTHLKSDDFFKIEKYPEMTFKSTKVKKVSDNEAEMKGDLTMLGQTHPVTLEVELNGMGEDPWGNERIGFSATGTLDRKDWGMEYNSVTDKGGLLIGNEVEILIEIEAIKNK